MALTAASIVTDGCATLLDVNLVAWSMAERLVYLNEAIRATILVKPDAYPVRGAVTPAAGLVQTLPDGGVALIDILYNTTGRKRAVTVCGIEMLQEANRFWPAATQQAEAENYAYDPRDPRRYLLFPPNDGTGSVYMIYGGTPAALTASSDTLPLTDVYQPALLAYVLSRCYAKNSQRQDLVKANAYRAEWGQFLGMKSQAQIVVAPKVSAQPGT
jgi:hypothetical protein